MLRKLKRKFILLSMLSVFFVVAVTIASINISNYAIIEKGANQTLVEVIETGLNERRPGMGNVSMPEEEIPPQDGERPDGGRREDNDFHENSFFIAVYDKDGNLVDFNYNHIFMFTEAECQDLSLKVFKGELKGRTYYNFRFKKEAKDDDKTYVAFVDLKLELDNAKKFTLFSSLISIGAFGVFCLLIFVAANIAFAPSEEAYKKQKKFITNASHELKTPLTVISADLDLVEMDHGKSEWTESIRNQVDRLTKMTKQLVDLSRLEEEDSSNYPFEDFSLTEVFNNMVKTFAPSFKKEKILFSSNISGNLTMYGNKHLIDELIYIFLENSLKYTGGDKKSSYFVVSANSKGKIEFKFSNTLDKDDETDARQVMERFYRAPSNKKDGSGIGLSVAQEIINLHKGKIKVDKNNSAISFDIVFD